MPIPLPRKLSQRITGLLLAFFVVALAAIGSTLFVSWRLEGGAAAINDAGSERMRSYRIAFLLALDARQPDPALHRDIEEEVERFERTLKELQAGNPARPLFLPREPKVRQLMNELQASWSGEIRPLVQRILNAPTGRERERLLADYRPAVQSFVARINTLVSLIEYSNARATTLLRSFQIGLVVLALVGTVALIYLFSIMVVRPVASLQEGTRRMAAADFSARVPVESRDELGDLARSFNRMAEHLQDLYATLEQRVADKTRRIEEKSRELAALYDVAASLNEPASVEALCDNVLAKMVALFHAQGGLVRLTDPKGETLPLVAGRGVSPAFTTEEACLAVGECLCGEAAHSGVPVNADFSLPPTRPLLHLCKREGFQAVVATPIRSKQRILGILNLFFTEPHPLPNAEIRLLESVGQHLGIAIENQRLVAREKEMAVSEERNLLAQELHDSIAQSLAFLNIQVQLLQDSLGKGKMDEALDGLEQIREGVQESYDDVRELLVHFRTRVEHADLESAVASAVEKFEDQTGIATRLVRLGPPPDLAPETALQVLHILQEALSNIRKHARARQVTVEIGGADRVVAVRDNGVGFDTRRDAADTHVGLKIMKERAHRADGELRIVSVPGQGTEISLALPGSSKKDNTP